MLVQCGKVKAVRVVNATLGVAHSHHAKAGLAEKPSCRPADLAVALHRDGRGLLVDMQVLQALERQVGCSASRGVNASFGTADVDRLARHGRGH